MVQTTLAQAAHDKSFKPGETVEVLATMKFSGTLDENATLRRPHFHGRHEAILRPAHDRTQKGANHFR